MVAEELSGRNQPGVALGDLWSDGGLGFPICRPIVLDCGNQRQPLKDAEGIGIEGKQRACSGEGKDLVGAGFANHGKLGESPASLGER